MPTRRNDFAGQTIGATVTLANSADSGDPFTLVSLATGAITYAADPASGGRIAVKVSPGGTSSACFVRDASFNSTDISISDCFYYSAVPSGNAFVHRALIGTSGSATVLITSAGVIKLQNRSGSTVATAASALTVGHWYRFETQVHSDATAGTIACQWYVDDGATQTGSLSASAVDTRGGSITTIDRGPDDPSTSAFLSDWWYSNIQGQDGTLTPLGAFPASDTPPTADAGPDQTGIEPFATVTLDGTGSSDPDSDPITYAWTQTAGPTVTLSSSTASKPTFTAPAAIEGATLTFSLVVNDGTSDSVADTVTITILPHTWWSITNPVGPVLAPIRASLIGA